MKLNKRAVIILKMGRGRKGVFDQGNKKTNKKTSHILPKENRKAFCLGIKTADNQPPVYYLSEEILNSFRQVNPRDVANILVNT